MLLTITYTQNPASDLGYLLNKNPYRPQTFELSNGKAYVFYSEVSEERCTAVLLLDINPIDLARGKQGSSSGERSLFDYVNDRPYVASSFLSTCISRVFGTAMAGKSKNRQELAEQPLFFEVKITMVPCSGGTNVIKMLFEHLGYTVQTEEYLLDENFSDWGKSKYYNISISGTVRLRDLLNHLYVLIPVMDSEKHYWVGDEEIDKLIRHGEGWLANHPAKTLITDRYLKRQKSLVNRALEKLLEHESVIPVETVEDTQSKETNRTVESAPNLNQQRMETVLSILKSVNAQRVIDIGCGEGNLLALLLKDRFFTEIAGVDVSYNILEKAKDRLKLDRLPDIQRKRINLFQGSLTYRDKRFSGYDAATIIEVIEHLDINRLAVFEKVLFKYARPKTVIVSTPNIEYNPNYSNLYKGHLRHKDHRFEWSREQFTDWAQGISNKYGYEVQFTQAGEADSELGNPTQIGVFTL